MVRRGLLALRQNVVLLRDPEDPNAFYPVGAVLVRGRIALPSTPPPSTHLTRPPHPCRSALPSTPPPASRRWNRTGRMSWCACTMTTTITARCD